MSSSRATKRMITATTRIYHVVGLCGDRTLSSMARLYTSSSLDFYDVVQEVCNVFYYNPRYIEAFRKYLRPGDTFTLTDDFDETHCIQITSKGKSTFRSAFGLMHRHCTAPASTGSLPQDSHILRLIRVSLKYPDRCVALVTLRGGDAQRAMDLIYKLLRYPEYWREEIPDISIGYRDFTLPRLFFELGKQASKQPADFICQGVQREPVRDFDYAPGGFADVFRGKLIEKDGKLKKGDIVKKDVALKKPRHTLSMTKDERALQAESTKHECLMWSPLSHPNIVKFLGVTESNKTLNDVPCMISPWRHELLKQIKTMRHQGTYPTTYELDHWLLDIAAGLGYLHSRHIVHANLQTSNILVSTEEDCVAQIADFALSFFADSDIMLLPDFKAIDKTPSPWHAPELHIATISELPTRRTFATDTFAFGCVCIELYTSHHPFYGQRDDQAAANVLRGVIPLQPSTPRGEKMDDALWQIISSCLAYDPEDRPEMAEVHRRISTLLSQGTY